MPKCSRIIRSWPRPVSGWLLLVSLLLSSCAPARLQVFLDEADPGLAAAVGEEAKAFNAAHRFGPRVELAAMGEGGATEPSLGVLPSASAASGSVAASQGLRIGFRTAAPDSVSTPGLVALPRNFLAKNAIALAVPMEAWVRERSSELATLPLLWEIWGAEGPKYTQAPTWGQMMSGNSSIGGVGPASLVFAGGKPFARQALFASAALSAKALSASIGAGHSAFEGVAFDKAGVVFASLARDPRLHSDVFHYSDADVDALRDSPFGAHLVFLRDSRSAAPAGIFKALHYEAGDGSYSLVGAAVFGYYVGSSADAAHAFEFLAWLAGPEAQVRLARATRTYPANLKAPRLDPRHAELEADILRASRIVLVNPDPSSEQRAANTMSFIDQTIIAPDRWQSYVPRQ